VSPSAVAETIMSEPKPPPGSWARADAYEAYVGRWSRQVAPRFLAWLAVPEGGRWLDVGCGTGALSEAILTAAAPTEVVGVDPSPAFVAHAAERIPGPRASFGEGDAEHLPVEDGSFDAVVSALVLNFVPDPPAALREMRRATRAEGTVAAYVWDYADGMQLMSHFWDAAVEQDPAADPLREGLRFAMCRPESLRNLFAGVGLHRIAVDAIVVPTVFADFDDYWSPFLGGQGPAPAYALSLTDDARSALREALRARLPVEDDGSIRLSARAWAVRGSIAAADTAEARTTDMRS
jgi:SAM-dependent methyltransferase